MTGQIGEKAHILQTVIAATALLFGLSACGGKLARELSPHEHWAAYYDMQADLDTLTRFDLLVLDSFVYPDLNALKDDGVTVLGYLSVGEVHEGEVKNSLPEQVLVKKNAHWGSTVVDVRQPVWYDYILNQAVPAIMAKGFDGVMLDTIDSALHLEETDPETYKGTREAVRYIVASIRHRYPAAKIMVNRGFSMLPDIAGYLDMILAEGTLSHYDLEKKQASHQPDEVYLQYLEKIQQAKSHYPKLKVYSLDYWDMNDPIGVTRIYQTQRSHGFVPYVTTPDLTTIHLESKASIATPLGAAEPERTM